MEKITTTMQQELQMRRWNLILIATLVVSFIFLQAYLSVIALSLLLGYVFHPMFSRFKKKMSVGLATTLTVFVATFIVILPVFLILLLSFSQLQGLVTSIDAGDFTLEGQSIEQVSSSISEKVNEIGNRTIGVENAVSSSDVSGFLEDTIPKVLNFLVDVISGLAKSIPAFFATLIIFLFLFTAALIYHEKIVSYIKSMSPFDEDLNKKYLLKIGAMTKAMLKGQMIIAIAQGFFGASSLLFLGLGNYFLFFWVVFSFLNLIPLGSGLITIPLGFVAILTGSIWPGVFVLATHFIVTTNVDNILRPKLVPKEAHLPASLLILGAFAGVAMFGLVGVVYGPIIMIIITTTIDAYKEYKDSLHKLKKAKKV